MNLFSEKNKVHVQAEVIQQPRPTTVPSCGSGVLVAVSDRTAERCRELAERLGEPLEPLRELSAAILPASVPAWISQISE